jgi:hypothetical protein
LARAQEHRNFDLLVGVRGTHGPGSAASGALAAGECHTIFVFYHELLLI